MNDYITEMRRILSELDWLSSTCDRVRCKAASDGDHEGAALLAEQIAENEKLRQRLVGEMLSGADGPAN